MNIANTGGDCLLPNAYFQSKAKVHWDIPPWKKRPFASKTTSSTNFLKKKVGIEKTERNLPFWGEAMFFAFFFLDMACGAFLVGFKFQLPSQTGMEMSQTRPAKVFWFERFFGGMCISQGGFILWWWSCFCTSKKKQLELKKLPAACAWMSQEVSKRSGSVGYNPNIPHL